MHIQCTNGSPIVDMLGHLSPLPLFVVYGPAELGPAELVTMLKEQDELGLYHALRLRDRVCHIDLRLPPSILPKVTALLDGHFPILEHVSLTFSTTSSKDSILLTLPKAFLAPNLRRLTLPHISPPRRLQLLTSAVSLVKLELSNIQTSGYFRPRVLAARLGSLPQLKELYIGFSIPVPRPSTERELLGAHGAPVTLTNLKHLWFRGVSAYLESLVAQIRVPRLERLGVTLFNEIAFVLPHLSYLINITEAFKIPGVVVSFYHNEVYVTTVHDNSKSRPLSFRIICKPLDWQINCAAQICRVLIPVLPFVEILTLRHNYHETPELRNNAIDSAAWHDLLSSFNRVKRLKINYPLLGELSCALQVDEVGSDPGFLPNLRSIHALDNIFTSFIDARQVVGLPVQFVKEKW